MPTVVPILLGIVPFTYSREYKINIYVVLNKKEMLG
jgi:hypothetical protein